MSAEITTVVADTIVGDAQDARWVASTAASQLAGARAAMLAGDLDDADAAIRRVEIALQILRMDMSTIIRRANRAR
jgi:hypothetical protein